MAVGLFLENNLKALREHRPNIAKKLAQSRFSHAPRRKFPAIPESLSDFSMLIVLGFGDAKGLRQLLQKKSDYQKVILFIEPEPAHFMALCHEMDLTEMIQDPSIIFFVSDTAADLPRALRDFFVIRNSASSNFAIVASEGSASDEDFFAEAVKQIHISRQIVNMWLGTSLEDSFVGLKATVDNFENCTSNPGFEVLRNRFKGMTVVSVASGPSLNKAIPFLKAHSEKFALIACDSSLQPLLRASIMPHFVTALEREPIVTEFFKNAKVDPSTTLIGPQLLLKSSVDSFGGRKAIYTHNTGISLPLGYSFLGAPLATGFSAGNLNISAAIAMGFKKIVMIGHDLCFDPESGATHVDGVLGDDEHGNPEAQYALRKEFGEVFVKSQDETTDVKTFGPYQVFRNQLQEEIQFNRDRIFINTSLKGANIAGTQTQSLELALTPSDHCGPLVKTILASLQPEVSANEKEGRLKEVQQKSLKLTENLVSFQRQSEEQMNRLRHLRRKLEDTEFSPEVMIEARQMVHELQSFRENAYRNPELQALPLGIFQPVNAPLEREVSLLNQRYKSEKDLVSNFFAIVERLLTTYVENTPRIIEIIRPLTQSSVESASRDL